MPRCPGCGLMASYDDDVDPDVEEASIDEQGNVQVQVTIVLHSACCQEEMKQAIIDHEYKIEGPFPHQQLGNLEAVCGALNVVGQDHPFDIEDFDHNSVEATFTSRSGATGKKGMAKKYYGADLVATLTCATCGMTVEVPIGTAEEQAANFEDLN